ncbi:Piwi domain-containing protein [Fusarium sp. LHS14.1]|nr:Piwi domain-containing protein [Fusarium sp. LHS14.1]
MIHVVYRDGVSEGQYDKVVNEELPPLRKACTEVYPASDQKMGLPHFTIVVVGKRHHTRFYPTKETNADRSGNPKPGTIVDRGVTEAPHAAIQGTARPGHYVVVLDEIFRARYAKTLPPGFNNVADVLEDLTQSLCYVYGRMTKAVSLCTPAYYADIVCERARCYLSGVFDTPTQSAEPSLAGSQTGGFKLGMKM